MHGIVALLFMFLTINAVAQQGDAAPASPWQTYGYVILGGIILIIVVVVLVRKQHRKFNE